MQRKMKEEENKEREKGVGRVSILQLPSTQVEPRFSWLLKAYTLMGGLRKWLRKAWICAKVGFARLRGTLLPSRTGFAGALA